MNIMTKRGTHDNIVTYEHICDTKADLNNIPKQQSTLGSVAIVVKDEGDTLGAYIANSEGEWSLIADISGGGGGGGATEIYICGPEEVDPETGLPSIEDPSPSIIYLVPNNDDPDVMYDEYIYKDGEWELFGTSSIDLSRKADIDGTYPDMTVGKADQLNTTEYVENNDPYLFRTTGGTLDTNNIAYEDAIVGGTIAWNQINNCATASTTTDGVTITKLENNKWHFEGTATAQVTFRIGIYTAIAGHVYYHGGWPNTGSATTWYVTTSKYTDAFLVKRTSANGYAITLYIEPDATVNFDVSCMICDLTQMFGTQTIRDTSAAGSTSTPLIANYIYDLEQTTPGAGVAWFRKFFPKSYYPYNPGELMSVKAISHDTVGFNAYDHEAGTAKLLGGKEYFISGAYTSLTFTDINNNTQTITLDSTNTFIPENNGILTIEGGDSTTTCVNLTWSGYRNGEFEPYTKYSYVLDSDLELHGVPMLDENNELYYDGDTYKSDGTVTRKYKIVDLGTLNWVYNATGQWGSPDISSYRGDGYFGICSRIFIYDRVRAYNNQGTEPYIAARGGYIWIRNTNWAGYTNAEVKTALNGVYLVYRLANGYETTETAEPFEIPQVVDDFGTEEYVDTRDIPIPVGHITRYPSNLRDKLQHLPFPAEEDGNYIIAQENNQMKLVKHTDEGGGDKFDKNGTYLGMMSGVSNGTIIGTGPFQKFDEDETFAYTRREIIFGLDDDSSYYPNGVKKVGHLYGGSIVWNQLIRNGDFHDGTNDWTSIDSSFTIENGIATLSYDPNEDYYIESNELNVYQDHLYLALMEINNPNEIPVTIEFSRYDPEYCYFGPTITLTDLYGDDVTTINGWTVIGSYLSPDYDSIHSDGTTLKIHFSNSSEISEGTTVSIRNIMLFDISAMFGNGPNSVANSILNNSTLLEENINWFKNLFPNSYYSYNPGQLLHTTYHAMRTTGPNLWDEEWEVGQFNNLTGEPFEGDGGIRSKNFIPIHGLQRVNMPHSIFNGIIDDDDSIRAKILIFYNNNKEIIRIFDNETTDPYEIPVPSTAMYAKFSTYTDYGTIYRNNLIFDTSWTYPDYFPYVQHAYSTNDIELKGLYFSDFYNNSLFLYPALYSMETYADIYLPDGHKGKKIEEWTFDGSSDEDWRYVLDSDPNRPNAYFFQLETNFDTRIYGAALCDKYPIRRIEYDSEVDPGTNDIGIWAEPTTDGTNLIQFRPNDSSITTVEQLRAYLAENPVSILGPIAGYGLDSSYGWTIIEPFQYFQRIDTFGTKEFDITTANPEITLPGMEHNFNTRDLTYKLAILPEPNLTYDEYFLVHSSYEGMSYTSIDPVKTLSENSITGNNEPVWKPGIRYICSASALTSLTLTSVKIPNSGLFNVRFHSGSTPTTLTVPNTIKWANGFDPTSLEANCTYELSIEDGIYGIAAKWEGSV